ncbi:BMC domain-containing protein [Streptococcus suis]|uniref:BMC domain-containing protein n=1 Tax=Streptococcus suis TaxID=1307 RepID=UPI000C180F01|nr:BMC domain-containing protein [Streptococcus suis]HEM6017587.1 BMC domain-containing protein [Streptococcus suis]
MKALGLVETYGYIGAIEAADVMLKVANVTLLKLEKVRGGLVTISIEGDVGAIKTAVEAGTSAVQRLNKESFIASHVIPRPDQQLSSILKENKPTLRLVDEEIFEQEEIISDLVEQVYHTDVVEPEKENQESNQSDETVEEKQPKIITVAEFKKQLQKKKAAELREMIVENKNISVTEEKLAHLVRKTMIAMLLDDFALQVDDK